MCVIGWLRERTHRLLLSVGLGPTPPRLTIFFASTHDPFRNSGSPGTLKGPMVFLSFSSDVDCQTEADVAAHSAAGNLEAESKIHLYTRLRKGEATTCFKGADSVVLDHSTVLRSKFFKEGDNWYQPMRNTDLWRSLLVHSKNSLHMYAVMTSTHLHLMLGLYPDPVTIFLFFLQVSCFWTSSWNTLAHCSKTHHESPQIFGLAVSCLCPYVFLNMVPEVGGQLWVAPRPHLLFKIVSFTIN